MKVAIIDCSVRKQNLPARLPGDIAPRLETVIRNEEGNTARISQFYRSQLSGFRRRDGGEIRLETILMEDAKPGMHREYAGLIIPDSFHTPTKGNLQENCAMQKVLELVQEAHAAGRTVLGVGFGYQLVSAAFGEYPAKYIAEDFRQIGYYRVDVKVPGGILDEVPNAAYAIFNNRYYVKSPPKGAEILMTRGGAVKMMSAFRMGGNTHGIQFMIDYSGKDLEGKIEMYAPEAEGNGYLIKPGPFAQSQGESAEKIGETIFRNFLAMLQ